MSPILCWFLDNPTFPVVLISAGIAYFAYRSNKHLTRAKQTIDFETAYHESKKLNKAIKTIVAWAPTVTWEEIAAVADQPDHEMVTHIREVLNTWERASMAVRQKVFDEDLLYNVYGSTIIWMWKHLVPYMRQRQTKNPRLYKNFDWLGLRWMVRRGDEKDTEKLEKLKAAIKAIERV